MGSLETVGVVGAGVMGSDLAQVLAGSGYDVVLVDVSQEALDRARRNIGQGLRLQRLLGGPKGGPDQAKVLDRIMCTLDYAALDDADFLIETVTEDWETKARVFRTVDQTCPPHCVLSSNTSVIPITKLAAQTHRPEQVIGTHFMNPVALKPMVEAIRGYHTSDETIATTKRLLEGMGKECIIVNDSPGFVSNRVLMLTVNEAMFLVHEQVASAEEVDRLFKSCFGQKMGPLETADLIGLDTVLRSLEHLHDNFKDSKFRPCPLLARMVDAGLHGRKTGQGFYAYGEQARSSHAGRPAVEEAMG